MSGKQTHYIYDEALKCEREYVETDGKAGVGDYATMDGVIRKVSENHYGTDGIEFDGYMEYDEEEGEDVEVVGWDHGYYRKLTPTGNVRIDGELFRLSERKADVGDTIIDRAEPPKTMTIIEPPHNARPSFVWYEFETENGTDVAPINQDEYYVLDRVDSANPAQAPKDETELLANLVRRVHELETENKKRRHDSHNHRLDIEELYKDTQNVVDKYEALVEEMDGIRRDLLTFAEVAESARQLARESKRLAESNAEDIVLLDARTQPEQVAETVAKEVVEADRAQRLRRFNRSFCDAMDEYYRKGGCV